MPLPRIAVTMGDPAGIGPEICLKLLENAAILDQCIPIIFGDYTVLNRVASNVDRKLPSRIVQGHEWPDCVNQIADNALYNLEAIDGANVKPGTVDASTGGASYRYIEAAIDAALSGQVDAVVTGPVHKEALHAAGVPYPGHTEIFAAKTNADRACMMLTCSELTCSFVTTHVGYCDVPKLLRTERIVDVLQLSHDAIGRIHNRRAKIVVCGLNPHAGENGLFGNREEEEIIIPAIRVAQSEGIDVVGPLPPDTAFLPQRRRETDCFVCMYHDQGHIPLKALAFEFAVNITLGLPIIRTSVDHGTACDIAWQGKADVTSLTQAVELAIRLANTKSTRGPS